MATAKEANDALIDAIETFAKQASETYGNGRLTRDMAEQYGAGLKAAAEALSTCISNKGFIHNQHRDAIDE